MFRDFVFINDIKYLNNFFFKNTLFFEKSLNIFIGRVSKIIFRLKFNPVLDLVFKKNNNEYNLFFLRYFF